MGSKYLESFISDFQIFSDGNRAHNETIYGRDMALSEYQGFEAFAFHTTMAMHRGDLLGQSI